MLGVFLSIYFIVSSKKRELLILREHPGSLAVFSGGLCFGSNVARVSGLSIPHCLLFSATFILYITDYLNHIVYLCYSFLYYVIK